jgi:uncharacterized protein (DUF697 family)
MSEFEMTPGTAANNVERWNNAREDVKKLIFKHSCIGGAIALIPIPFAGEIAVIINQVAMYRGINELVGIKFSDNILKNIGNFLLSQLAGIGMGLAALLGLTAAGKLIPGLNFIAALVQAPAAGIANYACGIIYYRMLGKFLKAGGSGNSSDEEIIRLMRRNALSEYELEQIKNEAERQMKGADYSSFKSEAQKCADEAQKSSI